METTLSKKELLKCFEDIANTYSMNVNDFLKQLQNPDCEKEFKAIYPESPIILEKSGKTYVTNLKCMLAENLYNNKTGSIIKIQDKNLKLLGINNPPTGWWVSEKLDGIRAIWDGEKFLSRNSSTGLGSKVFSYVPDFIKNVMPKGVALDGEIWLGRNKFNEVSSISNWIPGGKFKKEEIDSKWRKVKYKVFDVPNSTYSYEERMKILDLLVLNNFNCCKKYDMETFIEKVENVKIKSPEHLQEIYHSLTKDGAEGVMLRAPNSPYELKRSQYLLKFKIKDDAEGIVLERLPGTGRLVGMLGSLKIELIKDSKKTGIITNVGTGFSDEERTNVISSPNFIPVGSIISFSYMELTEDSVRHPSYRGIRTDIPIPTESKDLQNYTDYIILLLKQLIQEVESTKEPNWQFKKKQYISALNSFIKNKEPVKNIEDTIRILRLNGMKLDKEEEYFSKNKEYKSAIVKKIYNMMVTGNLPEFNDEFKAIENLSKIPEIGESKAKKLFDEYGVVDISELRMLYSKNPEVLTQKQATGLKYYEDLIQRIPRDEMNAWNQLLKQIYLEVTLKLEPKNSDYVMVGSYRRGETTSGDIDILVTSDDKGSQLIKNIKELLLEKKIIESTKNIFAAGDIKIMAVVKIDKIYRHLDIFYHPRNIFPFAILHSTGSAEFNSELRSFFLVNGYSLSEKGIKRGSPKGPDLSTQDIRSKIGKDLFEEEKDIFTFMGLPFIEPADRKRGIDFQSLKKK
jgi:DNA polymerase/3'-5' exonuclease PolX